MGKHIWGYFQVKIVIYSFQIHVLMEDEVVYVCITYKTDKYYIPFKFLETMKQRFRELPNIAGRISLPRESEIDRDFRPVMASLMVSNYFF